MDMEFMPLIIKQIPTILSISAIFFVYFFYKVGLYVLQITAFLNLYAYLNNK